MSDLINRLQAYQNSPSIEEIFVIFNNHFRGFAPQDVIDLKKVLQLPYKSFRTERNLLDYF